MERNKNIDLLRVIACVMVVVIHVCIPYVRIVYNSNWFTIGNLIDSFMRVSVPIFVLISGAFNLSNNKNKEYNYFYKKTLKNILLPTIVWGFIYCNYSIIVSLLAPNLTVNSVLSIYLKIFTGFPFYRLWYMYMIIGLYMITPIMIRGIEGVKLKKLFITSSFLLALGMVSQIYNELIWPFSFINYLGYYLLGLCLNKFCVQNNRGQIGLLIYIVGSLMTFIITEIIVRLDMLNNTLYFYEYLSPTVIISSIGIFIYFLTRKEIKIDVSKVLPHTFNIYLIHAGVYDFLWIVINKLDINKNPIFVIPLLSLVVFVISWALSHVINKIIQLFKLNLNNRKSTCDV